METDKAFELLQDAAEFATVRVGDGGCGVVWNNGSAISYMDLWQNGADVQTPFDGLMAFGDATDLWDLNESTLRKAVAYGKLVKEIDVHKFGRQWVVTKAAMLREYGEPTK